MRPIRLGPGGPWPRDRRPVPAFVVSLLLHVAFGLFFFSVPLGWLYYLIRGYPIPPEPAHHYSLVIYHLQSSDLADYLPVELPPDPGGAPGRGASHRAQAARGSSSLDPRITIVSQPKHPDNLHQTIVQPASPPKLKIMQDVPLPDLVVESATPVLEAPKPPPQLQPIALEPAKLLAPVMPAVTEPQLARPAIQPVLAVPPAPPLLQSLTLPVATPPAPPGQPSQPATAPKQVAATQSAAPAQLVSLSVNPAPLKDLLALPAGNREGAFSISGAGGNAGSPGGTAAGSQNVGAASGPSVGDLSISAGPGGSGGAGSGDSSAGATRSIAGGPAGNPRVAEGSLSPLSAEALVYPVDSGVHLRRPALVVSTGPLGGGGLGIYGVLHGPRIYTIYLVMAPRSWILQYCVREDDPPPVRANRTVQIQLQPALTPPAALDKFDFRRAGSEGDKANGLIILQGTIRENGSVGELRLLRGVGAIADQAAIAAFRRWKFSPALREGKPVAVEILVGIPAA